MIMRIRHASAEDAYELAEGLRKADRLELEAHGWTYPFSDALLSLLETSDKALSMVCRGDVIAIATTHSIACEPGVSWVSMMGSSEIARNPIGFIRACQSRMSYLEAGSARLVSLADSRNAVHLRFLKAFGFIDVGRADVGGRPFVQFTKDVERTQPTSTR
jgi:hypothetical protein